MSDAVDRGITVTEMAPMDQPIDVSPESTAAFVGRALRGPLNTPVLVHGFGEFRRRFGDVWSRSSLGPAVWQYFDHGGENLYVVRVANNARGAMICLSADGSALVLRALEPGSTESIRASVDLDGIETDNDELFNLTLQRIDSETGFVIDQELYRRANFRAGAEDFIADLLLTSTLARVQDPLPTHRPEATMGLGGLPGSAYVYHAQDGSDGQELSDYDLVGSRKHETGIFSLQGVEHFDLLYVPPPGKLCNLGPASILAAELYCRERGAMLIVDPHSGWSAPADAVSGTRDLGLASSNIVSYFPRLHQRGDDEGTSRAVGGALAGLLCKLDRTYGPWHDLDQQGMSFKREFRTAINIDDDDAQILSREGLSVIATGPQGRARLRRSVTMGRGSASLREFKSLSVRRTCLRIINSIDKATRWAVFELNDSSLAESIRDKVTEYLMSLARLGAFENDRFIVECNAGLSRQSDRHEQGVTILVAFHPLGCQEPISFTLHQTVVGRRVTSTAFAPVMENCA